MKRRTFLGILPLPAFIKVIPNPEPHACFADCEQYDDHCGAPCIEGARLKMVEVDAARTDHRMLSKISTLDRQLQHIIYPNLQGCQHRRS